MGDMDDWDCFRCDHVCRYRESNLCGTCEKLRLDGKLVDEGLYPEIKPARA